MIIKHKTLFFLILFFSLNNQLFAHELKKDEIDSIIKNFILENPQIIEKTLQDLNLERSQKNFKLALTDLKKIPNPNLKKKQRRYNYLRVFRL